MHYVISCFSSPSYYKREYAAQMMRHGRFRSFLFSLCHLINLHSYVGTCACICLIVVHVWVNFLDFCALCLWAPDLLSYLRGKGQRKWGRRCVFIFFPPKEYLPYDICYAWTNKYLKCVMHIVILTVISWNFKISYYCGSMIYGFYMAAGPVVGPSLRKKKKKKNFFA